MFGIGSGAFIERIRRPAIRYSRLRTRLAVIAVTVVGGAGLLFEAATPLVVSATPFYVGMVFIALWLPNPKAAPALALLATPLSILGFWISLPGSSPAWEAWANHALSIFVVWLVAFFVWRFRVLEEELQRQIDVVRSSEERFRSSVVQSPVPTILYDDREQILAVSTSWLHAAGVSAGELRRIEDWTARAFGERAGEVLELVRRIIATEPQAQTDELTIRTPAGLRRLWSFVTSGLGAKSDGRRLYLSVAQDITDRRAYEERIHLLMREARHRTKNILGIVQAIARQTAAGDAEDFVDRFTERMEALAANQDLLVRHEWQRIDVKDLVHVQLEHFADLIGTRINISGPRLHLNAAAAQAIGLALHELATNAGKYGALSTKSGCVDVGWQFDGDRIAISWTERNGPPVRVPERHGFGTTVTKSMVERMLGGEVRLDYAPSGVRWCLSCRATDALESDRKACGAPEGTPPLAPR